MLPGWRDLQLGDCRAKAQHCCTYYSFIGFYCCYPPTYFLSPCKLLTPSIFFGKAFMALPLAMWRSALGYLAAHSRVLFAGVDLVPLYLLLALLSLHCFSTSFSVSSGAVLLPSYSSPFLLFIQSASVRSSLLHGSLCHHSVISIRSSLDSLPLFGPLTFALWFFPVHLWLPLAHWPFVLFKLPHFFTLFC